MATSPARLSGLLGLLALPLFYGCADSTGPATPAGANAPLPPAHHATPADPNTGLVAEFVATLDPALGTIAIEPVTREGSAIGDTFSEVGLTPAFTGQFGTHFWADAVRWNGTDVEVDFATRHPFQPDKRPDLGIFNMKLWVGSELTGATVAGIHGVPDLVTNADGHSDMWNLTAEQGIPGGAPIQPYVVLHEDPTSLPFDFHAPAGWNVLFPGQSSIDTVALDLSTVPAGPITLHLYLTADYGQSAVRATRQSPAYELPKFAGNAPWKVEMRVLTSNLEEGNTASSADYRLDIWDWKHGQSLGSDVTNAQVFAPALQALPITPTLSGTGTDPTPLSATVTLVNNLDAAGGNYWGVVAVNDAASGTALKDDLVTPVSATYTTYQWFPIFVDAVPAIPPTAVITRCIGGDVTVGIEETFDGAASVPGSNPITTYEWDFDYNGFFDVEATGITANYTFSTPGVVTIAMRASDGFGNSDIETVAVTVNGTATWGALTRLTTNSIYEQGEWSNELSPYMTSTSDGVVHLLWYNFGSPFIVVHQELDPCSTTFGPEESVYTASGSAISNVSVSAGPDDALHVSFRGPGNAQYVYTTKPAGGAWSAPINVTTTPTTGTGSWDYGAVATAGTEVGFLGAYRRNQNPLAQNNNGIAAIPQEIYFTRLNGASFDPIQQIGTGDHIASFPGPGSTSGITPSQTLIGMNSGEFVGVWQTLKTAHTGGSAVSNAANLRWSRTTAGVWQPQTVLYSAQTDHDRCLLQRSPNGTIWLTATNGSLVLMSTYDGSSWSPALTSVLTGLASTSHHYVGFDAAGKGVVVGSASSTGAAVLARSFQQADSVATIAASPLMTPSPSVAGIQQRFVSVAARTGGRFALVVSTTRYGPALNGLELEYSVLQ